MSAAAAFALLASGWAFDLWVEIPPSAASAEARDDEVVVSGERKRKLTAKVRTDRRTGVAGCTLKRPSGDPRLDAAVCGVALACNVAPIRRASLNACMNEKLPPALNALYPDRAEPIPPK